MRAKQALIIAFSAFLCPDAGIKNAGFYIFAARYRQFFMEYPPRAKSSTTPEESSITPLPSFSDKPVEAQDIQAENQHVLADQARAVTY